MTPLFGPYGSAAGEFINRFADFGANAFWFHGFDPQAFEACEKFHIAPCVEFPTFRADFASHPELIPIGVEGRPIRYGRLVQGVCLSQKDFLDSLDANLLAGLQTFQPAGIWLDYLTYGGWFETPQPDLQESCFCPDCIADFCQSTGIDADTPYQILHTAQNEWTLHKCERIARFARHYVDLIHSYLPGCLIGAYMCPWTPGEFNSALRQIFAQDYGLLAPAIDIFTPLIYAHKSGRLADWGSEFLASAPGFVPQERKIQLILDILDFPDSLFAVSEASRPSWGIQLFGGAQVFADPSQAQLFRQAVEKIQGGL